MFLEPAAPDISVRAEIGFEDDPMQGLVEGRIDIGVMYTAQSRPGLTVERLLEERLALVTTERDAGPEPADGYVFVDWGPEFYAQHGVFFPEFPGSALVVNIGWLGLQHILRHGGSGYFRCAWSGRTSTTGGCIACPTRPSSGCRPTSCMRTSRTPMPSASLSGSCDAS